MHTLLPWIAVILLVLGALAVDLGVFHRKPHAVTMKEATYTSILWISLALLFNMGVYIFEGGEPALAFFTGYLLEKLLSLDNMFIFIAIFNALGIGLLYQHRVLFWGILGAIVFRLFFILIGIKLVESFEWILYVFGALLIYSSYRIFKDRNQPRSWKDNKLTKLLKEWVPLDDTYQGPHFFISQKGKWVATPMFLALLTIEFADVIFAVDSIPAIFAITLDPFIVFSSNIFAILGLRSLYFLLANVITRFYYLQHGISLILGFIGVKLMLTQHFHIPIFLSLVVIATTLAIAIVASIRREKNAKKNHRRKTP